MDYILEPNESHTVSLRELTEKIRSLGGDEDSLFTVEADGEPVYIYGIF